ncbi:hypothetical protein B0H19DRAFT_1123681 [Mycena capillaripes]|nr:hypothetical protein B0H19DRAFT_1156468 [Mycena capillaripes]KAJ6574102.1 hypothetical protein B0H19DRAFT_1123681 [Mycena capillaripes]
MRSRSSHGRVHSVGPSRIPSGRSTMRLARARPCLRFRLRVLCEWVEDDAGKRAPCPCEDAPRQWDSATVRAPANATLLRRYALMNVLQPRRCARIPMPWPTEFLASKHHPICAGRRPDRVTDLCAAYTVGDVSGKRAAEVGARSGSRDKRVQ